MKTQTGVQNVLMGLFRDSSFRHPITARPNVFPRVKLESTVYLGLTIDTDENYLALEVAYACAVWNVIHELNMLSLSFILGC